MEHLSIHHELVPGFQRDEISLHHRRGIERFFFTVPEYRDLWTGKERDLIQFFLGPYLLGKADDHVQKYEGYAHQGVGDQAESQEHGANEDHDKIEARKNIPCQDFPVGLARGRLHVVRKTSAHSLLDLGCRKAGTAPVGGRRAQVGDLHGHSAAMAGAPVVPRCGDGDLLLW